MIWHFVVGIVSFWIGIGAGINFNCLKVEGGGA